MMELDMGCTMITMTFQAAAKIHDDMGVDHVLYGCL